MFVDYRFHEPGDKKPKKKSTEGVDSELQDYLNTRQLRRRVFPRAALVGICAGVVALLFRVILSSVDTFRNDFIIWAHHFPGYGWIFPVIFSMSGALIAVAITRHFAPEASGSGIPHLKAVLLRFRNLDWKRILPVKFLGGIIAIGSGLALGREGPTVQMGGAVGDAISRFLKVSERDRLTLTTSGAGAGLAAAFNAPLSGLIFVLEEVRRDFQPIVFGATFVAAVIADIIARIGSGQFPVFSVPSYPVPPLESLPFFAILGVIAGLFGVLYNKGLLASLRIFKHMPRPLKMPLVALIGGMIGFAGWFSPLMIGSGHGLAEEVLSGKVALSLIPIYFFLRYFLTITSYGTGAPGGIFAPLLVLGSLLGLAIGEVVHSLTPLVVPIPAVFAVVGMAAFFTAIVRAPLTGIMLIVEMTGNYSQMLPLLISCFCAFIVAEALKDIPIYEALLDRDLKGMGVLPLITEPTVLELEIQTDAPFAGKQVNSLGLPAGCILVRCTDGKREWVPKANTRLESHMHITAIIAPEAQEGIEIIRKGCTNIHRQ